MDDKVYKPEESPDQPFPTEGDEVPQSTPASQGTDVYTAKQVPDKPFPKKVIAHETISQSLNTKAKKITGDYGFTEQGAITVGGFKEGVSGEIKISPDGIIAKNKSGNTTVAIDGDTGNATFAGEINGGSVNINNTFMVDEEGNVIANSIAIATGITSAGGVLNQDFTSSTPSDVTDTTNTIVLERTTLILILMDAVVYLFNTPSSWRGVGNISIYIDGADVQRTFVDAFDDNGIERYGAVGATPIARHFLTTLSAGTHEIKLKAWVDQDIDTPSFKIVQGKISVLSLGTPL